MQKVFYPYEYMGNCEQFNEASLPEKEDFYGQLNIKGITDADYTHIKKSKYFEIKKNEENTMICIFKEMHYS